MNSMSVVFMFIVCVLLLLYNYQIDEKNFCAVRSNVPHNLLQIQPVIFQIYEEKDTAKNVKDYSTFDQIFGTHTFLH